MNGFSTQLTCSGLAYDTHLPSLQRAAVELGLVSGAHIFEEEKRVRVIIQQNQAMSTQPGTLTTCTTYSSLLGVYIISLAEREMIKDMAQFYKHKQNHTN